MQRALHDADIRLDPYFDDLTRLKGRREDLIRLRKTHLTITIRAGLGIICAWQHKVLQHLPQLPSPCCVSDFYRVSVVLMSPLALPVLCPGYWAPEIKDTWKATKGSNVYSFGVFLLELLMVKSLDHLKMIEDLRRSFGEGDQPSGSQ